MTAPLWIVLALAPTAVGSTTGVDEPPPADDDDLIVEDDADEATPPPAPEPAAAAEQPADESPDTARPTDTTPPTDTADDTDDLAPGKFATGGDTKPPPSDAALHRDGPLALPDDTPRDRAGRPGSPQRFALEFKMGPYLPDIDRAYEGPGLGPFASIFGETDAAGNAINEPKPAAMPVLAFDWQFVYLAGPLGLGTQVGFFRDKAQALITAPLDPTSLRSEADETRFAVIPVALLLSYRFELLADRLHVPLVPYAKAGLGYALYWTKSGSGNLSRNSRGDIGRGGVAGWQLNAGGMLRLDFIEPGTAKKLDQLTGINHTYIFGEYQLSRIDNFGIGQTISLGDSTWFAGLAIEF